MIIRNALNGLKTSGASWRSKISETLSHMGYINTIADPDIWRRPNTTEGGISIMNLSLSMSMTYYVYLTTHASPSQLYHHYMTLRTLSNHLKGT